MNKNVFIISAYPSTPQKLLVLKECLRSLKRSDYDIILTTNYKLSDQEIYSMVDYLIFDKTDIQDYLDYGYTHEGYGGWYLKTEHFKVGSGFNNAYHYDLYRSTYNAIIFANSIGYEFFTYVEGDCILKDFKKLEDIRKKMFLENKKMFFGKIKMDYGSGIYYDYCTLLYGGVPSFYVSHTDIPYNVEDWVKKIIHTSYGSLSLMTEIGLEIIIYECFNKYMDDILEMYFESTMMDILEYNKIMKLTELGLRNIFYFNPEQPDIVYVLLHNNEEEIEVSLYFNEDLYFHQTLHHREWTIRKVFIKDILDKKAKLIVYVNGEIESVVEKNLTQENINKLRLMQKYTPI